MKEIVGQILAIIREDEVLERELEELKQRKLKRGLIRGRKRRDLIKEEKRNSCKRVLKSPSWGKYKQKMNWD